MLYDRSVRRIPILLGILVGFTLLQGVGLMLLGVLVYETIPGGVLARETFIGKIPGILAIVRVVDRATNNFYRGPIPDDPLPLYELSIDEDEWATLEEALPKEIHSPWYGNLFLADDSKMWVKGRLKADGEEYDVKVRARGDIFNHWAYRKKSLRIEFPKEHLFRGMRAINLVIPEDRAWFGELLNLYRAQKFDLPHPPMRFVTVNLNGSGPMLYVEIEHWTKEMIEKLGISDANVYQTGGGSSYFQQWNPMFKDTGYWEKYVSAESTPLDSYEEIEVLQDLARPGAHVEEGYMATVRRFFNEEELIRWAAHAHFAGSVHVVDHNLRLLFSRSKGRFIPIPWDVHLFGYRSLLESPTNALWDEFFRVPELRFKLHQFLWSYVTNEEEVNDDLQLAAYLRSQMEEAAYRDAIKLPSNRTVKQDLDRRMGQLKENLEETKKELEHSEVLVHQRVPSVDDKSKGILLTIDIIAHGIADARLHEIHLPDTLMPIFTTEKISLLRDNGDGFPSTGDTSIMLLVRPEPDQEGRTVLQATGATMLWAGFGDKNPDGVLQAPHISHRFFLMGKADIPDSEFPIKLDIRNAVTGKKADSIGNVLIDERNVLADIPADRDELLRRYPVFQKDGDTGVQISGVQKFWANIVIPPGVPFRILPGTEIGFGRDVSILSYAPVFIEGTARNPVRFVRSTGHPWGVFAVLNAKEKSRIEWAEFDGGSEAKINGAYVTGMVAFHASPVSISDATFRHARGDDGLNIKYIPADLKRLRFEDNAADAVDIDVAGSGSLEDSVVLVNDVKDSNGDGVDLSWSHILLKNVVVRGSGDKCVSIGERSETVIQNSVLEGCAIGIAVKDGSRAKAEHVTLRKNKVGIAGYVKKPFFPAPLLEVTDSVLDNNERDMLILSGATIVIDGQRVVP